MIPTLIIGNAVIYQGNNLDILPELQSNSVDSIVCDPPYELGFMGKSWDSSGIAYSVELWKQCLRVLKPGGHLLAFGGTRTWHRLAVAIEDAGFEIRDNIAWLYGSGFPKSHNISKAINKAAGVEYEASAAKGVGFMNADNDGYNTTINQLTQVGKSTPDAQEWEGWGTALKPAHEPIVVARKPVIGTIAENVLKYGTGGLNIDATRIDYRDHLDGGDWNRFAGHQSSKTIRANLDGNNGPDLEGRVDNGKQSGRWPANIILDEYTAQVLDQQSGISKDGTALKPAHEPIVVARKPVEGTVANNVLKYGTGGLNIDASRIETDDKWEATGKQSGPSRTLQGGVDGSLNVSVSTTHPKGRFPANIILDEYTAQVLDEQSGVSKSVSGGRSTGRNFGQKTDNDFSKDRERTGHTDSGGASRFFYVAKANKKDRNEGLDDLVEQESAGKGNGLGRVCALCGASILKPCECPDRTFVNPPKQNFHPTVKPTALMQYLIRLVTPDNGVVLDPFAGSGSTGKAAILEGNKFIGIELTEEYLPIIEGRLKHAYLTLDDKEDDLFE